MRDFLDDADEYLKTESEMDISEYVTDAKQYRTDDDEDNEQIEIYEPGAQEDAGNYQLAFNIFSYFFFRVLSLSVKISMKILLMVVIFFSCLTFCAITIGADDKATQAELGIFL